MLGWNFGDAHLNDSVESNNSERTWTLIPLPLFAIGPGERDLSAAFYPPVAVSRQSCVTASGAAAAAAEP
ncbi:hypothetical protein KJ059_05250 [Myxococcota bacterium]|nr:hypothetical protein [Myxococcota bacterium]MCZ7618680.1 hypothetical protein [Myxococcota bacterium]